MFFLPGVLIAGGLVYTGSLTYKYLRNTRRQLRQPHSDYLEQASNPDKGDLQRTKMLAQADQTVTVSSVALGITVVGVALKSTLMLASVPAALLIFAPTLREAWQSLRRDRRITPSVLDATRVALCVLMGFYFALALDTWLRTIAQRLLLRTEAELGDLLDRRFNATPSSVWCFRSGAEVQTPLGELMVGDIISIDTGELIPAAGTILHGTAWIDEQLVTGNGQPTCKTVGDRVLASTLVESGQIYIEVTALVKQPGTQEVRKRLEKMTQSGSYVTDVGIRSGKFMTPKMWAVFALLLPFWDANRAAGFLTTSFGNQMERLGPYALQNFATVALQQNILIYDGRVLESLNLVNAVIIDAALLADETVRAQVPDTLAALRRRRWPMQEVTPHRFAVYLLGDHDEAATKLLAATLGFDDYFVAPSANARAELLERLKVGGRFICYVGNGAEDTHLTEKVLVTVALPSAATSSAPEPAAVQSAAERLTSTTAQVVLIEKDLQRLEQLFALSTQFGMSQGMNVAWPLLMDLADIATTVFIHFGLTYSILFTYSGLLGSALYTRLPLVRYLQQTQQPQQPTGEPLPPDRQLTTAVAGHTSTNTPDA